MSSFELVSYVAAVQDTEWSHITDLTVITVDGQDLLYSATRYDGVLRSWQIDGGLSVLTDDAFSGALRAGGTSSITTIDMGTSTGILTGGGVTGALQIQTVNSTGSFGAPTTLTQIPDMYDSLHHMTAVTLSNGQQVIYGGLVGANGIGAIRFTSTGGYHSTRFTPDSATTYGRDITGMDSATLSGNSYLFSLSGQDNGLTSWAVGSGGVLTAVDNMGVDDALWTHAPSALAVATVGAETFVVLGAAGSGTLSVIQVSPNGQLTLRDHLLDDRTSRFDGVSALDVISHQGQSYVVAGGSDDGISIFQILPGGQLVARGHLADTTTMGLANPSAISLRSNGTIIDIFVASSTETGVTHLTFDTGPAGQTIDAPAGGGDVPGAAGNDVISGLGGDDILRGRNGDDILRDGAGSDVMIGGAGADVFVLAYDAEDDVIDDFVVGEDRIDLSGWPMLRAASQLTMSITSTGMLIVYGDERLVVNSADGAPIDHRTIAETDLIGGARIPEIVLPGYAGPYTPDPNLPGRFVAPSGSQDDPFGYQGQTIQGQFFYSPRYGAANGKNYYGGAGFDTKHTGRGNDRLYGGNGKDTLYGDKGVDRLSGGAWHDRLSGGNGDDIISGNLGDDKIFGGDGRDRAYGGYGDDIIYGNVSDDILYGQQNNDTLMGGQSNDRIYGGDGNDRMFGETGHDMLDGGNGNDLGVGGKGRDIIYGRGGSDRLYGSTGTDKIYGNDGDDKLYGGDDFDLIKGGRHNDKIWGSQGSDNLQGESGNDWIDGGKNDDRIWGGTGNDTLMGGTGNDVIKSGKGQDTAYGGANNDVIFGENANDRLYGGDGYDTLFGGDGNDELFGEHHNDYISGGNGDDRALGGEGHDHILGDNGNDRAYGQSGNDTLNGGAGNDTLFGGAGNDTISGDRGDDTLWGSAGNDTFNFWAGADRVADFNQVYDSITLDYDLWEGTLSVGDVLTLYGSFDGTTLALDFDNGNVLTIAGITDYDSLADAITIV